MTKCEKNSFLNEIKINPSTFSFAKKRYYFDETKLDRYKQLSMKNICVFLA